MQNEIVDVPFVGGFFNGQRLGASMGKNRYWPFAMVDGLSVKDWTMDRAPRPELLDGETPNPQEHYWRVGDGDEAVYVHSSLWDLLPDDDRPPESVLRQAVR